MEWRQREPVLLPKSRYSIIENLARIRGIQQLNKFLNPTRHELHNPRLLKNIEEASEIIIEAVRLGKKICVSVDCDSDGIMSTGIMVRYLKQFTKNVYYIYNQRSEGHGVENQLKYVQDDTYLVIVLDSSSNSVKACRTLQEKGIKVVVLDHHGIDVKNPYCVLVNPQNDDYPNKDLSGAGVTFKTIQVMDETLKSGKVWDYIDICAIGIYGDQMDVSVMENRYLIMTGMKNIKNYGIKAVLKMKNVKEEDINSQTLGFNIVPLINGATRMDKIELAIQLVLCDDYKECIFLAEELNKLNDERKKLQKELAEEYIKSVDLDDKILIAIGDKASKSFNGLVAQNISQDYQRPTLVLRRHKGSLSGSYRTYGDFNIQTFLRGCKYINSANGHPFAGGVVLYERNLQAFKDFVNKELQSTNAENVLEYDMELNIDDISENLIRDVEKFNYLTGKGFPTATFKVTGLVYDSDGRQVIGQNKNHVKIKLDEVTLIKFNVEEKYASNIPDMSEIEVVGQLNLNVWESNWGRVFINNQIILDDIKII